MPSNSQSVFKYHRNASLTFLGGKWEQFGESGDGDTTHEVRDTRSRLRAENPRVGQKIFR